MKSKKMALLILFAAVILNGFFANLVYAGAAYIYEMANPGDTGYAGAGLAARAGDAGTVFTNPAGMTRFQKPATMLGATVLYLYVPFDPDQDTTASGPDGDANGFVPGGSLAYIHPVSESLTLGISAQNYFGLSLDWGGNWVGRYQSSKVTIVAPQLQPTIAYKVNDWLSVGAGAGLTLGYISDEAKIDTPEPDLGNGKFKYDDTDFAVQGNFGVMIEPSERTRIGVRYLTETDLDFDSDIYFSGEGPIIADLTKNVRGLDLGMHMPQSVMAGIFHQVNDEWAILGSVGWDDWSRFAKIHIRVDGTGIDEGADAGFDDTWHYGVGVEHQYTPKLMLTGGFSYDSSMSKGSTRPLTIPLGSMYRYGVGFKYQKRDDLILGGGLSFMWEGDLPVKTAGSGGNTVSGQYENVNLTFVSFYAQWL